VKTVTSALVSLCTACQARRCWSEISLARKPVSSENKSPTEPKNGATTPVSVRTRGVSGDQNDSHDHRIPVNA